MATNVKRKKKAEVMSDDGSMTLTGHLKELRNRLIICAAVFVVGVIGFLAISDKLIDLLTAMAMNANYTFVFLAPQEKLMQYFRVSLIAAVIVTIPVALYQVYAFAKPGLKRSERFFFRLVLLFGLALFCVGVLFAYKVTLPFMLNFLVTLEGTDYITASISIESYINLCLTMFIIFGCVFEMPLVTIILAKMGIANPEIMKKGRGVASGHDHPVQNGHHLPGAAQESPRRRHCLHLLHCSCGHPARYRVAVLRGCAHVPAVLYQHLPQRHFL